jgi:hypothetical protein
MSQINKVSVPIEVLNKLKLLSNRYYELKNKSKLIDEEILQLKNYLESNMIKYNLNNIETNDFNIVRKIITQTRISKEDLPEKIVQQYSYPISFSILYITKPITKSNNNSNSKK